VPTPALAAGPRTGGAQHPAPSSGCRDRGEPRRVPGREGWLTWQAELTASMTHFSKHFDTLSSRPVASQWGLQKAEIWTRGFSCENSERFGGCTLNTAQ